VAEGKPAKSGAAGKAAASGRLEAGALAQVTVGREIAAVMAQEEDSPADDEPQQLRRYDRDHLPLLARTIRAFECSLAS
jgi:hypothetical protein